MADYNHAEAFAIRMTPILKGGLGYAYGKLPSHDGRMSQFRYFGQYFDGTTVYAPQGVHYRMDQALGSLGIMSLSQARLVSYDHDEEGVPTVAHYNHVLSIKQLAPRPQNRLTSRSPVVSNAQVQEVYRNIVEPKVGWLQLDFCCMGRVKGEDRSNPDVAYAFTMLVPPHTQQEVIRELTSAPYAAIQLVEHAFDRLFGDDPNTQVRRMPAEYVEIVLDLPGQQSSGKLQYPIPI